MTFARLSAVYGLSFGDVSAMPQSAIRAYLNRIPAVLAERRIVAGDGASLPWLKDPAKAVRDWQKIAYEGAVEKQVATPGLLKMIGIGVEYAS